MTESKTPTAEAEESPEHKTRFGHYRQWRPFYVRWDDYGGDDGWRVIDKTSEEQFGKVIRSRPMFIDCLTTAAPSNKVEKANDSLRELRELSLFVAADHLWRLVYPIKSRWWLAMRSLVHGYDWVMRAVEIVVRIGLILVAAAFAIALADFLWDARGLVHDIVLQWLEGARDRGKMTTGP